MCPPPCLWRRADVSVIQGPEDFVRSISILKSLPDGSDVVTAAVTALFDPTPVGAVNIIRHSLVIDESLGPVEYYPSASQDITITAASMFPLRIIGQLEARWCGTHREVIGQRIAFAPKYYSSSFLVTDDDFTSSYSVIFGLQTISALQLLR